MLCFGYSKKTCAILGYYVIQALDMVLIVSMLYLEVRFLHKWCCRFMLFFLSIWGIMKHDQPEKKKMVEYRKKGYNIWSTMDQMLGTIVWNQHPCLWLSNLGGGGEERIVHFKYKFWNKVQLSKSGFWSVMNFFHS